MPPRTSKQIARRIDSTYHARPHWLRRTRRGLTFLAGIAALAWVAWAFTTKSEASLNPGPVSTKHAFFANDCRRCHTGADPNGFSKAVTDTACLTCHSAPAHTTKESSRALSFTAHDGLGSASCTACHVEHRGHAQATGKIDALCTQCHADLASAAKSNRANELSPSFPMNVTAFSSSAHPEFGANLKTDPTPLKFDHALHISKGLADCTACHTPSDSYPPAKPIPLSIPSGAIPPALHPPYQASADRPVPLQSSTDGRYMKPIRYEKHCIACHKPEAPAQALIPSLKLDITHESLPTLRGNLITQYQELTTAVRRGDQKVQKKVGPRLKDISWDDWRADQIKWIEAQLAEVAGKHPEFPTLAKLLEKPAVASPTTSTTADPAKEAIAAIARSEATDVRLIDLYTALVSVAGLESTDKSSGCAKCHTLVDAATPASSLAAIWTTRNIQPATSQSTNSQPATAPTPAPSSTRLRIPALLTAHTGIFHQSRRWYTASHFDHAPHRAVSCTECHRVRDSGLPVSQSRRTSDLLLPKMQQCTTCHAQLNVKPIAEVQLGRAPTACTTCHVYHSRAGQLAPAHRLPTEHSNPEKAASTNIPSGTGGN